MRGLHSGLLDESFGCSGPTLASKLGQSQLSDVLQRTRVQWELFDYSNRARTVSNPKTGACYSYVSALQFPNKLPSATLPCYGLFMDAVALRVRLWHRKNDGL